MCSASRERSSTPNRSVSPCWAIWKTSRSGAKTWSAKPGPAAKLGRCGDVRKPGAGQRGVKVTARRRDDAFDFAALEGFGQNVVAAPVQDLRPQRIVGEVGRHDQLRRGRHPPQILERPLPRPPGEMGVDHNHLYRMPLETSQSSFAVSCFMETPAGLAKNLQGDQTALWSGAH